MVRRRKKNKSHVLRKLEHKDFEYSFLCFLSFMERCKNDFLWLLNMEKMKEIEN